MTDDTRLSVDIRNVKSADIDFVIDSWLKSYRESEFAKTIRNTEYYDGHRGAIGAAFTSGASVAIACDKASPSLIVGWLCARAGVIHYAYVKSAFRRHGVAQMLIEHADITDLAYSHVTPAWERWLKRHDRHGRYNPYAFFT